MTREVRDWQLAERLQREMEEEAQGQEIMPLQRTLDPDALINGADQLVRCHRAWTVTISSIVF